MPREPRVSVLVTLVTLIQPDDVISRFHGMTWVAIGQSPTSSLADRCHSDFGESSALQTPGSLSALAPKPSRQSESDGRQIADPQLHGRLVFCAPHPLFSQWVSCVAFWRLNLVVRIRRR
jgi:hypothetical protein